MARSPTSTETSTPAADTPVTAETPKRQSTAMVPTNDATLTTASGFRFKVKKFVNLPVISLAKDGTEIVCRILDAIHESEVEENRKGAVRRPAEVTTVESMGGAQGILIASFLIKEELTTNYPNDTYVGCWFHIKRLHTKRKANGDSYGVYSIVEVEPDYERVEIAA